MGKYSSFQTVIMLLCFESDLHQIAVKVFVLPYVASGGGKIVYFVAHNIRRWQEGTLCHI